MTERSELLGIKYLKGDYFREGEEECQLTRSLWLNKLKNELETWDFERTTHPTINKLKYGIYFKTLALSSRLYSSSNSNRTKIWSGIISNKGDFLFNSQPYNAVISDINLSLNSFLQLLLTSNLSLHPIYTCYKDLFSGIVNNNENLLQQGMDKLKESYNCINPDLIVLNDDIFPINRAILLVARELSIPTVEIQHGIYMPDFLPTGREADYLFVWGEYFKDIYLKNKIKKSDQIKVLGYPYQIKRYYNHNREKKLVIYLGQNYEAYDKDLISSKVETLNSIQKICDKLNFNFVYRPHPADDLNLLSSKLSNISFTSPKETLQNTIKNGDIFISFNSTTLVEVSLHSKLGIQLKSYDLPTEDFEEIGTCSKTVENFKELEEYLKQIKNGELSSFYKPVKDSYINIPSPDPGKRFWELIQDII